MSISTVVDEVGMCANVTGTPAEHAGWSPMTRGNSQMVISWKLIFFFSCDRLVLVSLAVFKMLRGWNNLEELLGGSFLTRDMVLISHKLDLFVGERFLKIMATNEKDLLRASLPVSFQPDGTWYRYSMLFWVPGTQCCGWCG
jgi:hypothetical protein